MSFFRMFRQSAEKLKQPRTLVTTALLMAVGILLSTSSIRISPTLEISLEYLATAAISLLFGPVVNGIAAVATDIISTVLAPNGSFFFWFALNPVVSGIVFSTFFYHKKITWWRVILAKLLDTLLVNMFMTPLWLSLLYGEKSFLFLVSERILKNAITFVPQVVILYAVMKVIQKIDSKSNSF